MVTNHLRLHLGCGHVRIDGFTNCDLSPTPATDEVFDVQGKWPFPDNSAVDAYASHLLEHLTDPRAFFREAWRVLVPNGAMLLRLPHGAHRAAWWDIDHVRPWFPESFCFLQPGYDDAVGNPQHEGWAYPFAISNIDVRLTGRLAWLLKRRWRRKLFLRYVSWLVDSTEELWVYLMALKTPEAVAEFRRQRRGNVVFMRLSMYQHHLDGREATPGEAVQMVVLGDGSITNGDFGR